jgi:riboflavin transporter FmnP
MKKLNTYLKVAIGCFAATIVLSFAMVIFVLMPIYSVVGSNLTEVDAKLDVVSNLVVVFNVLLGVLTFVMLTCLTLGVMQHLKSNPHKPKKHSDGL